MAATVNELGSLPEDWHESRFGTLFQVQQGKQVSKKNRLGDNQKPFLRTKNVFWDHVDLSELDQMHFTPEEETRLALQAGDLLICEGGAIGRTALWRGGLTDIYFQNHLHRARLHDPAAAEPQFILYWLWYAFEIGGVYFGRGNDTTIPNLSKSKLCDLPLPLPSLDTQRAIARVLTLLRRAASEQDRIRVVSTELKKSLLQRLFKAEPERDQNRWMVKPIREIAVLKSGGTPSRRKSEFWEGGTIPWVKTSEVANCTIEWTEEHITEAGLAGSSARRFPAGTLLMAMYGQGVTRAKVALLGMEAATNQACLAFFPTDEVSSEYLFYLFQARYEDLREYGHGANQKNLSGDIIGSIQVAIPTSREEQAGAVRALRSVDGKIEAARRRRDRLEELFRTVLHELMTGQRSPLVDQRPVEAVG